MTHVLSFYMPDSLLLPSFIEKRVHPTERLKAGEVSGHLAARRYRRRRGCRFRLAFRIAVFLLPTTGLAEFDFVQYDDHCALFLVCYAIFPDILVQPAENIDE